MKNKHITKYTVDGEVRFRVSFRFQGERIRRQNFHSYNEALAFYTKSRLAILNGSFRNERSVAEEYKGKKFSKVMEQFATYYFRSNAVKPSTKTNYRFYLGVFEELLGSRSVGYVSTKGNVDYLLRKIALERGWRTATLNGARVTFNRIMYFALRNGLIEEWVPLKQERVRDRKEKTFLSPEELTRFFGSFDSTSDKEMFFQRLMTVMYSLALRYGETVALRWENVSFENSSVLINQNYTRGLNSTWHLVTPKNGQGAVLPLPPIVIDVLKKQRQWVTENSHRLERPDLVFPSHNSGCIIAHSQVNYWTRKIAKRANINKTITAHTLRRSWTSLALERGIPVTMVAQFSRHRPEILLRSYQEIRSQVFMSTFADYKAFGVDETGQNCPTLSSEQPALEQKRNETIELTPDWSIEND